MGKPGGWDYAPLAAQRIVELEQEMSASTLAIQTLLMEIAAKDQTIRDLVVEVDSWKESHSAALALLRQAKHDARKAMYASKALKAELSRFTAAVVGTT